ncbi:MAG: trypsin-like peptidase domain-containing protein, partial [Ignavibacteriaceae bacterium]|nr:trypsin-like peptidase domain-containing protein [Ignavibacteriaceae bacterium]
MDNVNTTERSAVTSVFMVINKKLSEKGSSFLIKDGPIITNAHVVTDCNPEDIILISIFGEILKVKEVKRDTNRDLAALIPEKKLNGGVVLANRDTLKLGSVVTTWGFPLGYNGPAPLLSVGFLSGYSAQPRLDKKGFVKHLVVNGAFNPGNSGG